MLNVLIVMLNAEYLCRQEEECTSSSWGHSKTHTPGTIAPTEINKNGVFVKVNILVELG